MTKNNQKGFSEFVRFCVVGGTCAVIDAIVFYIVRLFAPYQLALISGYLISYCVNYVLNVYWTFKTTHSVHTLLGITGAHMFNLFIVRMGLMWFFVEVLGIDDTVAYIPVAIIGGITNFLVIRAVVRFFGK